MPVVVISGGDVGVASAIAFAYRAYFLPKPFNLCSLDLLGDWMAPRDLRRHLDACGVSPRARTVVELLAQGLTAKEVALKLRIEPTTVRTHMQAALGRAGARSVKELVWQVSQA